MPKFVYNTATSFNGYIADEANSLSWLFEVDHSQSPDHERFMSDVGVLVFGSTTYEWVLREDKLLEQPTKWDEHYGDRQVFVFTSRKLQQPQGASIRFASGPVAQQASALQQAAGSKNVWIVGGGDLAGQFYDAGLLDEIQLTVAPVALTGGAPVLPRKILAEHLDLVSVEKFGQFAHLIYLVKR